MTIDELISKKHVVRIGTSSKQHKNTDWILKKLLFDEGIILKAIGTDYVFPRIIQTSEGEKYLIWDQTYWEIFEFFLLYLAELNTKIDEAKQTKCIDTSFLTLPRIILPFSYYLALVIKNPSVSINFALYYNQRDEKTKTIESKISADTLFEYIQISKTYVVFHEIMHLKYKHNEKRSGDIKSMENLLENAYKFLNRLDENFYIEEYLKSKSTLLEMVETAFSDHNIQEELLCDTYALNNCLWIFCHCWSSKYTQKEIITKCQEAIRIVDYFNSLLISLKLFWEDCSCNIDEMNIFRQTISLRCYLSEIIGSIQLLQQGIYYHNVDSLWNFGGFEDNYLLEYIFKTYFTDNDAVAFWKNTSTIKEDNKQYSKFELLKWRTE